MEKDLTPDYLTLIRNRGSQNEKNIPWKLHQKQVGEEFVRSLGIATPEQFRQFSAIEDISFDGLPDKFVLKPTFLSSNYGVMVLEQVDGTYRDHLRNRTLSFDEIIAEQKRYSEKSNTPDKKWIIEEKVIDADGADVPDDFKFYAFQGRIGLIHRTTRNLPYPLHSYYTGDFEPIPENEYIKCNPKIITRVAKTPPSSWKALLVAARRISVAVPTPFVRVDMYNTTRGPVFGEFTLVPGTFYYEDREIMNSTLSARMGKLWVEAAEELRMLNII